MSKPKRPLRWCTKRGVVVEEVERALFWRPGGGSRRSAEWKILGRRLTGGCHGWLWLRNLTEVKP